MVPLEKHASLTAASRLDQQESCGMGTHSPCLREDLASCQGRAPSYQWVENLQALMADPAAHQKQTPEEQKAEEHSAWEKWTFHSLHSF